MNSIASITNLTPVSLNNDPMYEPPPQKTRTPQISPLPTFPPKTRNSRNLHLKNVTNAAASDYAATAANLDTGTINALSNPNEETRGPDPTHHAPEPLK